MSVPVLHNIINLDIIQQAYDIAWDYLYRTGAIENEAKAHAWLLSGLAEMHRAGLRNKLVMANKAIVAFRQTNQAAA